MSFLKLGEQLNILGVENATSCVPVVSEDILNNFKKFATNLKKIAPKAEDFLYFSAIMMHAAEASALNDDGTPKLTIKGEPVQVSWNTDNGTWKWKSNDPSIKPFKNSNGDIFPELELIKAHKKWVGKPLCIDHKSSSVDHTRGFIVDTYYDRNLKRVVGLCALDKANYPELARKVSTGMQTAVSMGTAVSKAICYDCAKVAQTEQDFCDHMRHKSCYGEINIGLNPIELSIVVNGADPKAHIKHVIAAAQTMNNYLENRSKELNKIAINYSAQFNVSTSPFDQKAEEAKATQININSTDLETFEKEVKSAFDKLKELKDLSFSEEDENISALDKELNNADDSLSPPHERFAEKTELTNITTAIENKLSQMQKSLDTLLKIKISQEEKMSGSNINKQAYFQGTEEPTPGQTKYPVDPTNVKVRDTQDKHMLGETPFPDTGSVEDLYPGDLERKKLLARAEAEERAMKRAATVKAAKQALESKAYFQGTEEPALGKTKYPADKMNETLRDKEDKHMVGQKPFPNVGNVDGLYPSPESVDVKDEKKRKEMMNRASFKARFIKGASKDDSVWEVFFGDKLVLTASVADLSGGRSELLFDSIATKDFGSQLIEKIKVHGADKVRNALIKKAQEVAPPAPEAVPAPAGDVAPPVDDSATGTGDPKEVAKELATKAVDIVSDLSEAVNALTGEQVEMGNLTPVAASDETNSLNIIREELNHSLIDAMKETIASLKSNKEELDMIVGMFDKGALASANQDLVNSIVGDAVKDARGSVNDGFKLLKAFSKYARGTKAIFKRAEIEAELNKLAKGDSMSSDLMSLIKEADEDLNDVKDLLEADDNDMDDEGLEDLLSKLDEVSSKHEDDNDLQAKPEELKNLTVKPGTNVEVVAEDLSTRSARNAMRAKLAAETVKFSPILHDAHPKGGFTTELDIKPSDDLALVEDLEETHDKVMDVATAPVKVRKEAETIHKLISEGRLDVADLDALVAEGLDKDAVTYYKKYFGQVDGGSEFANELVKEHVKAHLESELENYKFKLARAYEMAYDMVDRGLCHFDRQSVSNQVEEIMSFNDASFESLKKVIARNPITLGLHKEASFSGKMPQVGMLGSESGNSSSSNGSLFDELSAVLSNSKKRNF